LHYLCAKQIYMNNLELLKSLLSVPSHYREEGEMVKFIVNWLNENNIPFYVDELFNIYATKTYLMPMKPENSH